MQIKTSTPYLFLRSLVGRVVTDNISFLSGGVAFYGMLALFPAMTGLVSLFGLVASPKMVGEQLAAMKFLFPPDVFKILEQQLNMLLSQPDSALSLTVIFSIVLTIYSATKGTKAMLAAMNSVYRTSETRSWFFQQAQSYVLTFGALLLMMMAVFIVIAIPLIVRLLPDEFIRGFAGLLEASRWLILSGAVFCGLFVLFTYGPNRKICRQCFHAVFWGAFIATSIWIAVSVGGSMLVQLFPAISGAYGSLSAIIALMMWIYISCYAVLIGGAIAAVAEEFSVRAIKTPGLSS